MSSESVTKVLLDYRESNDMPQSKLAQMLGVTQSQLSMWELGMREMDADRAAGFARSKNADVRALGERLLRECFGLQIITEKAA